MAIPNNTRDMEHVAAPEVVYLDVWRHKSNNRRTPTTFNYEPAVKIHLEILISKGNRYESRTDWGPVRRNVDCVYARPRMLALTREERQDLCRLVRDVLTSRGYKVNRFTVDVVDTGDEWSDNQFGSNIDAYNGMEFGKGKKKVEA